MSETNEVKKEWNRVYYVYNEEILGLINHWREAPKKMKPVLQARIIDRMSYMINKKIASYKESGFYEDLLQEGRMGIIAAMEKFDSSRSPNFFQYSGWYIQNKIRVYLKKERRKRREIPTEEIYNCVDEDIDPVANFEGKEAKELLRVAIDALPEIDRKIVEMRFGLNDENKEGQTYQQIGDVFSLTRQRIEQIHSRAISKLRKNTKLKNFFDMR